MLLYETLLIFLLFNFFTKNIYFYQLHMYNIIRPIKIMYNGSDDYPRTRLKSLVIDTNSIEQLIIRRNKIKMSFDTISKLRDDNAIRDEREISLTFQLACILY